MMREKFAYGVDLGWVSQLEQMGYSWIGPDGKQTDPIRACRDMGANAVRFRVFADPPGEAFWQKREDERCMLGFCDAHSVLAVSRRVRDLGMDLMLDLHYSDHFADPQFQDIPGAWENDGQEALERRICEYTKSVMRLFRDQGVFPKWVQVGNEINPGILLPRGGLDTEPEWLVRFLNAGYEAVKDVLPDCLVITHLAGVQSREWCEPFLDNFFRNGGRTDILGFSHYPYWYQSVSDKEALAGWLAHYREKYGKPVMIAEVGGEDRDEEGTYRLLCDAIEALGGLPDGQGIGIFYWEPEVCREILPDRYPLGAAKLAGERTLQYTKALTAYRKYSLKR